MLDLAAAVFIGNVTTVGFLWCLRAMNTESASEIPWWAIVGSLAILLPVAGLVIALP